MFGSHNVHSTVPPTLSFKDIDFISSINEEITLVYYKTLEQCTYDVIDPSNVAYNKLVQLSSDNKETINSKKKNIHSTKE